MLLTRRPSLYTHYITTTRLFEWTVNGNPSQWGSPRPFFCLYRQEYLTRKRLAHCHPSLAYKSVPVQPVAALVANISTLALQEALSSTWQLSQPHYDIHELSLLYVWQLHNVSFEANAASIFHLNKHNVEVFYYRVNWQRFNYFFALLPIMYPWMTKSCSTQTVGGL